jgi:hypothetical protein
MNIESIVRNLAKSNYYQNLYNSSKETNCIQLFNNMNNYSGIQSLFLYWLRIYSMLYDDLMSKESIFLTENVINDEIRCDAYLFYKRKKQEREIKKYNEEKQKMNMGVKDNKNTSLFNVELRGQ